MKKYCLSNTSATFWIKYAAKYWAGLILPFCWIEKNTFRILELWSNSGIYWSNLLDNWHTPKRVYNCLFTSCLQCLPQFNFFLLMHKCISVVYWCMHCATWIQCPHQSPTEMHIRMRRTQKVSFRFLKDGVLTKLSSEPFRSCSFLLVFLFLFLFFFFWLITSKYP